MKIENALITIKDNNGLFPLHVVLIKLLHQKNLDKIISSRLLFHFKQCYFHGKKINKESVDFFEEHLRFGSTVLLKTCLIRMHCKPSEISQCLSLSRQKKFSSFLQDKV